MKTIIPALDLFNGSIVRLFKGDFEKVTTYHNKPIEILKRFLQSGATKIHIINLNGAKSGEFIKNPNYEVLLTLIEECKKIGCKIQIGGGIRTERTIRDLLDLGVDKVIIGTIAFDNNAPFKDSIKKFRDDIIVALDVLNRNLMIRGWTHDTKIEISSHFKNLELEGFSNFIITDISRDGTLNGPNIDLYKEISDIKQPYTKIIASGGIKNEDEIERVLCFVDGVIIGKALYNHNISNNDLRNLLMKYDPTNLTRRIIPCLDVKDGRVVKGINFNNLKECGDPIELSKYYNAQGADELVFLDISATLEKRGSMIKTIRKVAEEVYIPFTVGGGIRHLTDITNIIKAGAEKVNINTAAVNHSKIITQGAHKFGSQSIVVAIDVKKKGNSWEVYIKSGTESTGLDAIKWAQKVVKKGAGELLVTSIDRDGTQKGFDLKLINTLSKSVPVPIIASGGAGNYNHFFQAINAGAEAVLAASLFHNKMISIKDLKIFLFKHNIKVRL